MHHNNDYTDDAIMHLPIGITPPEKKYSGEWLVRVPAVVLASFGWDAGLAAAIELVESLRRPGTADVDKLYNLVIADVLGELDRLRSIGR